MKVTKTHLSNTASVGSSISAYPTQMFGGKVKWDLIAVVSKIIVQSLQVATSITNQCSRQRVKRPYFLHFLCADDDFIENGNRA
jgi:hypothetical protein